MNRICKVVPSGLRFTLQDFKDLRRLEPYVEDIYFALEVYRYDHSQVAMTTAVFKQIVQKTTGIQLTEQTASLCVSLFRDCEKERFVVSVNDCNRRVL